MLKHLRFLVLSAVVVGLALPASRVLGQSVPVADEFGSLHFRSIGPATMSGRITDFAVYEANPSIYYVATAHGGVWKTTSGGAMYDAHSPAVKAGKYPAGLIIHEGQLTFRKEGLQLLVDLGIWWKRATGLPLPLGVNVVRKDLGPEVVADISRCMRESIQAGLANRAAALEYALQFARGMDVNTSDEFVGMYVNERTLDMGDEGITAIKLLLQKGADAGLVPSVAVEVVD